MPFLRFADLGRDEALLAAAGRFAAEWLRTDEKSALAHAARWFELQTDFLTA